MRFECLRFNNIWWQKRIPVIFRQQKGNPVLLKLPYEDDNRSWIQFGHRAKVRWVSEEKHWEMPVAWFEDTVNRALERYGRIYVVQLLRRQQKCAPACWNAKGFHCECSCLGEHHGNGHPSGAWYLVTETFAFQWGELELSCRLLHAKQA